MISGIMTSSLVEKVSEEVNIVMIGMQAVPMTVVYFFWFFFA